jgi:RHS repeat-associated protein
LGNAGEYSAVWRGNVALAVYIWGDTLFNHANQLGSTTLRTNQAGTAVEDILFYPWGQNTWKLSGSGGYNFAGMPYYDTTTNTDLTQFRLYSPGLGRWHSPDPMAGDLTNPQSLNRYAYVLNNPTTLTDPQGLQGCPPGTTQGPGPQQCSANALAMTQVQMGWGVMFTWDLLQLMEIPVYTWVPPGEVQVTINGTSYPAQWQPGYWAPTGTVADASAGLLESLGEIGSSPSWWGTFVGSFVKDFSLKGARRPGESYGACVERVENSLFGGVGAQVFGAVTGTSLVTGAFTGSFGTQTLPGVIDIATRAPLAVPNPSLAAMAAESAAQLGTISAEAAGTVSTVAAVLGKVFVPVAAVTGGIAGGILASCR